jgi:hypothetical protein
MFKSLSLITGHLHVKYIYTLFYIANKVCWFKQLASQFSTAFLLLSSSHFLHLLACLILFDIFLNTGTRTGFSVDDIILLCLSYISSAAVGFDA